MDQNQQHTKPFYIFFLMFPGCISEGFVVVTLPYLLTNNGFSVAETAAIVAVGASTSLFRFIWAPLVDLTLSLRKWYFLGVTYSVAMLLVLCFVPFTSKGVLLLTVIVFISQVAARFSLLPVCGFMAHRIEAEKKGRAAGWYQAGAMGATGLGGGAGLWLATHYSVATAGFVLGMVSLLFASLVWLIKDFQSSREKNFVKEVVIMGKDVLSMLRVPVILFVIILFIAPIGTGAATNLWAAIANDWKTDANTVALVTGVLSGIAGALGSVVGGFIVDRWGIWMAYLGSGSFCALVTVTMAIFPLHPIVYITYVLAYAFALGLTNAAFSSVVLYAAGKKNAATKFTLLTSLGNVPVVYMTVYDGWIHDRHNSKYMLVAEAVIGVLFIFICAVTIKQLFQRKLIPVTID
jgi:predicted MFS family arabinose efflux permease